MWCAFLRINTWTAESTSVIARGSIWKSQLIFLCLLLNWTESAPNISQNISLWVDLIFEYDIDCVYKTTEKLLKRQPQWNVAFNFRSILRNENYTPLFICHEFPCIKVSAHCFRLSLCLSTSTSGYSEIICAVSKLIMYIIERFIFLRSLLYWHKKFSHLSLHTTFFFYKKKGIREKSGGRANDHDGTINIFLLSHYLVLDLSRKPFCRWYFDDSLSLLPGA